MNISTSSLTQMLGGMNLRQQHEIAILKLSQDQIKQDGANALTLLQSVPGTTPQGPLGQHIDFFA